MLLDPALRFSAESEIGKTTSGDVEEKQI